MILDSTLREGLQRCGLRLGLEQRWRLLAGLARAGVAEAEIGVCGRDPAVAILTARARAAALGLRISVWCPMRIASDGRIDIDSNRYSVPQQFLSATLEVTIKADTIQVFCQDRVVAEHSVHPGRHQVIEDPGHTVSFSNGLASIEKPSEIRRPLSHYAAIVGGETW